MSSYDAYHPSGAALPAILQRKLKREGIEQRTTKEDVRITERNDPGRVWTATSIEQGLQQTAAALQLIQKQIARGEECYVDEASQHNIYKGWDGFIDCRETNSSSGGVMTGPPRRMQSDNRWFSNSFNTSADSRSVISSSYKPMGEYVPDPNAPKKIHRRRRAVADKPKADAAVSSRKRKEPEKPAAAAAAEAVVKTTEKNIEEPAEKKAKPSPPPATQETAPRSSRPKRKRKSVL